MRELTKREKLAKLSKYNPALVKALKEHYENKKISKSLGTHKIDLQNKKREVIR
mgnify:FL=1